MNNNNTIFTAALIITVSLLMVLGVQAGHQNNFYKQTQNDFAKGIQLYKQGHVTEAITAVKKTVDYYPDNYSVATVYAQILYDNRQYAESLKYMNKAEQLYPAILTNPQFLFEHARVLLANGQFSDSKLYLIQVVRMNADPEMTNQAKNMIEAIDNYQKQAVYNHE